MNLLELQALEREQLNQIAQQRFEEIFDTETQLILEDIFSCSRTPLPPSETAKLHKQLSAALTASEVHRRRRWRHSPSGENHIALDERGVLFLNIYGFRILLQHVLITEGDMGMGSLHWMEDDHLVVFKLENIPHNEYQTCICHYTNDDTAFTYCTEFQKYESAAHTVSSLSAGDLAAWFDA